MLKIIKNPDEIEYNEISQLVKKNDGYCPCMLIKKSRHQMSMQKF